MDYVIEGGNSLQGEIAVYGSKNCALALLGATALTDEEIILTNCPQMADVQNMIELLKSVGKKIWRVGDVVGISGGLKSTSFTNTFARLIRGSTLVLGSVLGKYGNIQLPLTGGCDIGSRPINIHLDGLRAMGVAVNQGSEGITCEGFPRSTTFKLPFASVGATQNLICASVLARGKTTLYNCAVEPEIVSLQRFLVKMGAKISGIGCSTVTVEGVEGLHATTFDIIADRIVTATYLSAVVCAGGDVTVTNCQPRHISCFLKMLCQHFDCKVYRDKISLKTTPKAVCYGQVQTAPYPGFPTDIQQLFCAMVASNEGSSATVVENLFENRLRHNADQLSKMGASITVDGNVAQIRGRKLVGATVIAGDLRGGSALVLAGLSAQGTTTVQGVEQINRGYVNLAQSLRSIGARVY